jgi:putative ABC transport system substrate-binding protein
MEKRVFCLVLAAMFIALSFPAQGQQGTKIPQIGFLSNSSGRRVQHLREDLRELGYLDGQNIVIVKRAARRKIGRLPELATELVNLKVDIIVAAQGRAARLVASLARPGGNVTGFSMFTPELGAKLLELLKESFPSVSRVGVLWHPDNPTGMPTLRQIETVAPALGIELHSMEVPGTTPHPEFDRAFQTAIGKHVDAFIVVAVSSSYRKRVLKLIAKTQLPAIYYRDSWIKRGGLMFYGPRRRDLFRLAAGYVDRILKGAKPGDLPAQRARRLYLV